VKLVLFDIDGTILLTDGAGRRAMEGAMAAVYGSTGASTYRYDGKTDRQIAREQMREAGFDDATISARMDTLFAEYERRLRAELEGDRSLARLCAGVEPLLDALEARDDAMLGLLTGNIEQGARHKLRAVGIDFARFRVNAFGSDHEERPQLPAVAQRRARELAGVDLSGDRIVIIGDTPADIHCGRALGVRAIGVATGRYSVDDLAAHGPAAVFATLEDTEAVVAAMLD
jgi:phosphoglycolate phosphatase-like HAD superfamily hydrolase